MKEQSYIIIHNNSWHPAQAFADTVYENHTESRVLDASGNPYRYKHQPIGFDLSKKDRG